MSNLQQFNYRWQTYEWILIIWADMWIISFCAIQCHFTRVTLAATCPTVSWFLWQIDQNGTGTLRHERQNPAEERGKPYWGSCFRSLSVWCTRHQSWNQNSSCPLCGSQLSLSWACRSFSSSPSLQAPFHQTGPLSWLGQCRCKNRPWWQRWYTPTPARRRRECTRPTGEEKHKKVFIWSLV